MAKVPASACFMTWSVLSVTQFLPTSADQTARRVVAASDLDVAGAVGDQFAQRNFAGGKADKLRQVGGNRKSRSSSLRLTESAMTSPVNALVIDRIPSLWWQRRAAATGSVRG